MDRHKYHKYKTKYTNLQQQVSIANKSPANYAADSINLTGGSNVKPRIKKAKQLFNLIVKRYTDSGVLKNNEEVSWFGTESLEIIIYGIALNMVYVYLGFRPAYLWLDIDEDSKTSQKEFDLLSDLKEFDKDQLEIVSVKRSDDSRFIVIINPTTVNTVGLQKEYHTLKTGDWTKKTHNIVLGRLLGYLCPIDPHTVYNNSIKLDKGTKKRYIYDFILYKTDSDKIMPNRRTQLFAFICYDKSERNKIYKQAIQYWKKLQKITNKITDKAHVGMEYSEQFL